MKRFAGHRLFVTILLLSCIGFIIPNQTRSAVNKTKPPKHVMEGLATHYGCGWNGRIGTSGVRVNCHDPVAAHKTLPEGTVVKVINNNPKSKYFGKWVLNVIFDRGPYGRGRVLDMMPNELWQITDHGAGGVQVRLEIVETRWQHEVPMDLPHFLSVNGIHFNPKIDKRRITHAIIAQMVKPPPVE